VIPVEAIAPGQGQDVAYTHAGVLDHFHDQGARELAVGGHDGEVRALGLEQEPQAVGVQEIVLAQRPRQQRRNMRPELLKDRAGRNQVNQARFFQWPPSYTRALSVVVL
jgi:hypothetical protein